MLISRYAAITMLAALLAALAQPALASPPWSLEELFHQPWPTGNGVRYVALSDDGAWLACAWDAESESIYDLWAYDIARGEWQQLTDLWPEREARLRRRFARELAAARAEWQAEHEQAASDEDEAAEQSPTDEKQDDGQTDESAGFDEEERIEDFEKDLLKQWDTFGGISEIFFLRDSHEIIYGFEGRVYSLNLADPEAAPRLRLESERGYANLSRVPESDAILLTSDSDVLLWQPADNELRQLTAGGWSDYDNASVFALSSDLRYLATVRRDYTAVRKQQMPELLAEDAYMTEHYHVRPQDTPEVVQLLIYDLVAREPWEIEVELPDEPYYQVEYLDWSPADQHKLLIGVIGGEGRNYRAYLVTPIEDAAPEEPEYKIELIYHEEDEAWINWARTGVRWDSGGGLLLHSERDGLAGLYRLVPVERDSADDLLDLAEPSDDGAINRPSHEPQELFAGEYEVAQILPLRHSPLVLLQLLYPDPTYRAIGIFDLKRQELLTTITGGGMARWQALSDDEQLLAYTLTTEARNADLHLYRLDGSKPPQLVLDRNSDAWLAWTATWHQQFMSVPGDGGDIPVKLWLPPDWRAGESYPLLIWLHGAGYAQTVNREPGFYQLFHPWVAEELGWIVAEVDYRGSEGYGRDWRVAVWGRLGHPEVDDIVAVKDYLVGNYGADPARTALWGWSYGGFLTLMALGLAPEDFPIGCAVAPVNRWENYFYWYSTCRLGRPDENKENYERSAAETYLENVAGDLLILHGLRDDNTLFQSVAQYLEKGHQLGVDIELKLFPSDNHGIGNEHHYVRLYEAIINFCTSHWTQPAAID